MSGAIGQRANQCCRCAVRLPADRVQQYCNPCKKIQERDWRKAMMQGPTREFPGVDIDAVHRNPRWKKIRKAA